MKLVVEVVDAHDLMPKDGEGSAGPFLYKWFSSFVKGEIGLEVYISTESNLDSPSFFASTITTTTIRNYKTQSFCCTLVLLKLS